MKLHYYNPFLRSEAYEKFTIPEKKVGYASFMGLNTLQI